MQRVYAIADIEYQLDTNCRADIEYQIVINLMEVVLSKRCFFNRFKNMTPFLNSIYTDIKEQTSNIII